MARLGNCRQIIGVRQSECGFDPWVVMTSATAMAATGNDGPYNSYLKAKGYDRTIWAVYANGSVEDGRLASGWFIENDRPISAKRTAKRRG